MRYCFDDAPRTGEQNVYLNKNTWENVASNKIQHLLASVSETDNRVFITLNNQMFYMQPTVSPKFDSLILEDYYSTVPDFPDFKII